MSSPFSLSSLMVFVAAHVGAGFHSSSLESAYLSDLKAACKAANASMQQQGNGMQATVAGISILEVCRFAWWCA